MSYKWYVVYAKPRSEDVALDNLKRQGFDVYLPKIEQVRRIRKKATKVVVPLFPRYLFIRLDLGRQNISPIRSTRGVCQLVRFSNNPVAIPDEFISPTSIIC